MNHLNQEVYLTLQEEIRAIIHIEIICQSPGKRLICTSLLTPTKIMQMQSQYFQVNMQKKKSKPNNAVSQSVQKTVW